MRLFTTRALLSLLTLGSFFILTPIHHVYADPAVKFVPSSADVNDIGGCEGDAANSALCQDIRSETNPLFGPTGILTRVAGIFGIVTGVIAVFMMLTGGLRYINSNGDPAKTSSAKKTIIYASVGVVVASIGGVLVRFVLSRIG